MNASSPKAKFPDAVQKLIATGYDFNYSRHFILTVKDASQARLFLQKLCNDRWLVRAHEDRAMVSQRFDNARCPLSLGLTFAGMQKLGMEERLLDVMREKAPAFTEGASARAEKRLGDFGASAAGKWEAGFKPETAHLLLILHADNSRQLAAAQSQLEKLAGKKAFAMTWHPHDAEHLNKTPANRLVHFGMRDGLSNPKILPEPPGPGEKPDPVHNSHRLGEFVLGYDGNDVPNPWRLAAERPESTGVPVADQSRALADFFKNGSFAAFRKIEQDEPKFRDFVQKKAETLRGKYTLAQAEAFIRAKLLGRWDDSRVVQADDTMANDTKSSIENCPAGTADFDFAGDQAGRGCPFGSHIRRMNPRDDTVVPIRRRPILRRGMPYGKTYIDGDANSAKEERGLLGLFFCASLEHQFEHLVGQWANDTPMGTNNRGNARDPLIGQNDPARHVYDIPLSDTATLALRGLEPFVTTKGTLYAFFPSLSAIQQLADR